MIVKNKRIESFYSYQLTTLAAEDGAHALAAVLATETRVTLTMSEQTFPLPATPVRTIMRHVLRDNGYERHLLRITVVVVQRKEPMARLHVVRHFLLDRRLHQKPILKIYLLPPISTLLIRREKSKKKFARNYLKSSTKKRPNPLLLR